MDGNPGNVVLPDVLLDEARSRLIVAIDTPEIDGARRIARTLKGHVGLGKVGLEIHYSHGAPQTVEAIGGLDTMVDGKFHDIPHTVGGAVAGILGGDRHLLIRILNVHISGGLEMLKGAVAARDKVWEGTGETSLPRPQLLGVTILTTQKYSDFVAMGFAPGLTSVAADDRTAAENAWLQNRVLDMSAMAKEAGLDGVIVPGPFAAAVREKFGPDFVILCAGIRFAEGDQHDQVHIATPQGAIENGATYVVMGRGLTEADDPAAAADRAVHEIATGLQTIRSR
ncbi:MAG: orotidine-5'-phosphate decarboxylase [Patescibacteria group bacterium]